MTVHVSAFLYVEYVVKELHYITCSCKRRYTWSDWSSSFPLFRRHSQKPFSNLLYVKCEVYRIKFSEFIYLSFIYLIFKQSKHFIQESSIFRGSVPSCANTKYIYNGNAKGFLTIWQTLPCSLKCDAWMIWFGWLSESHFLNRKLTEAQSRCSP